MMSVMATHLPSLVNGKSTIPLVTDDEKGFAAIGNNLPKIHRLLCWNHLISAVKFWLRKHGATSAEVPVYVSDVRELLHQPSAAEYKCQLEMLKLKWSESFYCHYMKELDEKVCSIVYPSQLLFLQVTCMCARWNLEQFGIYNPLSGITNNQSEGFNSVLKRMTAWKEMPIDNAVLSLYHLQAFYWNEWQRGLAGLSELNDPAYVIVHCRCWRICLCFRGIQKLILFTHG